jgi:hypothetical protein
MGSEAQEASCSMGTVFFAGGKPAGACSFPLASIYSPDEQLEVYVLLPYLYACLAWKETTLLLHRIEINMQKIIYK